MGVMTMRAKEVRRPPWCRLSSGGMHRDGRKFALTKAQVRLAQAAMAHRDTSVSALCAGSSVSGR